jgi:hypothetical protein
MGTAALAAEVLKTLEPLGVAGLILVLCFLGFALWITRKAFRNGLPVWVKVTYRSLEYSIGAKGDNQIDPLPQEGGKLDVAVEPKSDISDLKEQLVDAYDDEVDDEN